LPLGEAMGFASLNPSLCNAGIAARFRDAHDFRLFSDCIINEIAAPQQPQFRF
jgi:hypothetical protein